MTHPPTDCGREALQPNELKASSIFCSVPTGKQRKMHQPELTTKVSDSGKIKATLSAKSDGV
eukprot:4452843-Amphidinium_carterae.1